MLDTIKKMQQLYPVKIVQSEEGDMGKSDCPQCKGFGWVHPRIDDGPRAGDPDYRTMIPCRERGCYQDILRGVRTQPDFQTSKGMKPKQTFESFEHKMGTVEAYNAAFEFASGDCSYAFLLMHGISGNGKTHLINATALMLSNNGVDVRLFMVSELLSSLRQAISDNTIESVIKHLKEIPVLLLDDFRVDQQTNWANSRIEEIFDYRYECRLPLMMTTNNPAVATQRALPPLPERMVSRFSDPAVSRMVINQGDDYRRR